MQVLMIIITSKNIDDDNNYTKILMMIIMTSKIFKGIGGNNYIENIQRDWWE